LFLLVFFIFILFLLEIFLNAYNFKTVKVRGLKFHMKVQYEANFQNLKTKLKLTQGLPRGGDFSEQILNYKKL